MNNSYCSKCGAPKAFVGSLTSGRLECQRCKDEAWMKEVDANIKAMNQAKQLSDEEQEDNKGLGSYMVYDPAAVGTDWTTTRVPGVWLMKVNGHES